MKTLKLTLRLRMIEAAMADSYTQSKKPQSQSRQACVGSAPGWAVVTQYRLGQAMHLKTLSQMALDNIKGLAISRLTAYVESAAIVQNSQRVAPFAVGQNNIALEIHLP
jgi:hypothetical protein